jgi:hypothetical protein
VRAKKDLYVYFFLHIVYLLREKQEVYMEYEREVMSPYTEEELSMFIEEGARVYMELMEKHDGGTIEGTQIAFNIMCYSMIWWIRKIINPDDRRKMIHSLYRIITDAVED